MKRLITPKLIRRKLHTSFPQKQAVTRFGKKTDISLFIGLKGFELILAVGIVFSPFLASASFFSTMSGFFSTPGKEIIVVNNSQNMALLQAATNIDPNPAQGGADISVVDQNALEGEVSLTGGNEIDTPTSDQISIYEVHAGDTLASISKMFNVSVNTIRWANDIKKGSVSEGDILTILPITGIKYSVKSGDSIASIAKKYKADVADITRFNNVDESGLLSVGTTIIIPDAEQEAAPVSVPAKKKTIAGTVGNVGKVVTNLLKSGFLQRPLKSGIKTQGIHGHNGIDIGVSVGAEIFASADGKVLIAKGDGYNGGYGGYVVIQHTNGVQTLYAHLSGVNVSAGSQVTQGQIIGHSGNSGKSTGPHLHYEVRGAVNPF